jgi:hypothetical protein
MNRNTWPPWAAKKLAVAAVTGGGSKKICLFCWTNHLLRNKISLPALPDFNAGKLLFLRPAFYLVPTLGLFSDSFSDRIGWQI